MEVPAESSVQEHDYLAFDAVTSQINALALARKFGIPIDSARGSYVLGSYVVKPWVCCLAPSRTDAINSLDWQERVRFVRGAMQRLGPFLPAELKDGPPERFAKRADQIALAFVRSLDQVDRLLRTIHDEARMRYPLDRNTVSDFAEFRRIITDYCGYHYTSCVSRGGRLLASDAYGLAKELIERAYRRRGGDIVSAYNDAHDGTNGGMRVVLDLIADALKAEAVERYLTDVFDRCVAPNSWDEKVDMVRQFIAHCGHLLAASVVAGQPERYAQNYRELIRSYVEGLRHTSSIFRRL